MRYTVENKTYQYFVGEFSSLAEDPHIHTHLEMIFLLEGRAQASADGKWFDMAAGDLFLAGPNQIHRYRYEGDVRFLLIIFSADMEPELEELLRGKMPLSAVVRADRLPRGLEERLYCISDGRNAPELHRRLEAKGDFLAVMGQVLPLFEYQSDTGADRDSVKTVLTYCTEHCTEPLTLSEVAKRLHLSKFYISHFFRQRMDMGFTEFINRLRVARACELLDGKRSMTEVAFDCGFSSIRTFNRVFREEMHLPPRDYIRQKQAEDAQTDEKIPL